MASLGDSIVQFPITGSYIPPNALMRTVQQAATAIVTSLTSSLSSQLVLANNPNRLGMILRNNSPNQCYIRYGDGPANSNMFSVQLGVGGSIGNQNSPFQLFTGEVHAVWDTAASGSLKITEFT